MDGELRDAYLARLGLEAEPPSVPALFRLHRAHVERIPYETVWIYVGERRGVDPVASVQAIVRGRGGYCFHLNGAMSELLASLGYDVVRHVGGVHGPGGPTEAEMSNHLVVTVHGLPTGGNPSGDWYLDAGLGDALHEPLPLRPGEYRQPPWDLALSQTPGGLGDWHLDHDPHGGFAGMAWRTAPATMDTFASTNVRLSTDPESPFVKVMTAQVRDASGVTVLRGLVLKRIGSGASETDVSSLAELTDVLGDLFDLDITAVDEAARRALWERLRRAHDAWVAAGRP